MKRCLRCWTALALAAVLCLGMCSPALAGEDDAEALELYNQGIDAWNAGDMATALERMMAAAELGDMYAQYAVGYIYAEGLGVEQDYTVAEEYFRQSAEQGYAYGAVALAIMYFYGNNGERDYARTLEWARKAAELGDPGGQEIVGEFYEEGYGVVDADCAQAAEWYEKSAAQGQIESTYRLGMLCEYGIGVEQDQARADELYEQAYEAIMVQGDGMDSAAMWILGAERDDPDAEAALGYMYATGTGTEMDYDLARQWFERAAALGSATAMANLAEMYEKGEGVDADMDTARELYEKAAGLGEVRAQAWLDGQGEDGAR